MLAKTFGWDEERILDQRGHWIDWMLELIAVHAEVEKEQADKH